METPTSTGPKSVLPHNHAAANTWSAGGAAYDRISRQIADAIEHCVDRLAPRPGEHVLDLFGGSGSTLIACEQTGRRCFMMELDPLYADVIVTRWEKFTGQKAERVGA